MLVWERMTRNPYTVTADIAVPDALRRMHTLQVRRFPVVDAMGQLIGIVAEHDLLYASPSPATTLSVHEIQSLRNRTCSNSFRNYSVRDSRAFG